VNITAVGADNATSNVQVGSNTVRHEPSAPDQAVDSSQVNQE